MLTPKHIVMITAVVSAVLSYIVAQLLQTKTALIEIQNAGIVFFLVMCFVVLFSLLVGWLCSMFVKTGGRAQ